MALPERRKEESGEEEQSFFFFFLFFFKMQKESLHFLVTIFIAFIAESLFFSSKYRGL